MGFCVEGLEEFDGSVNATLGVRFVWLGSKVRWGFGKVRTVGGRDFEFMVTVVRGGVRDQVCRGLCGGVESLRFGCPGTRKAGDDRQA